MSTATGHKKHIDELHAEHRLWINNMKFYRDELTIYEHRLEEIITRYNKVEVTAQVEHFQNQFIRNKEVAEDIIIKCLDHDKFLATESKAHPVAADHMLFADHTKLRDMAETYEKLYSELKSEYMDFLRKWM